MSYFPGLNLNFSGGTLASTTIYVRISASAAAGTLNGTITLFQGSVSPNVVVSVTGGVSTNYYTKPVGAIEAVASYGVNPDGSGASPADFVTAYQNFIVTQATASLTGPLDIPGTGSKLIVGNGTTATTFTIPATFAMTATSKVDVSNFGTLVLVNNTRPFLNTMATGSTVNFAQTGLTTADTIKVAATSYYNLIFTK